VTASQFFLPDLGEGLTGAELTRWLVAVGDRVEIDQPVAEVLTAKTSVELPSPFAGVVTALHHAEGALVAVGEPLLSVTVEGPAVEGPAVEGAAVEGSGVEGSGSEGSGSVLVGSGTRPERSRRRSRLVATRGPRLDEAAPSLEHEPQPAARTPAAPPEESRVPAVVSPVVRRLARQRGVDLSSIKGTGPSGLIKRVDVEAAAARRGAVAAAPAAGERRIPIRGQHRQMAELVTRSRREIPEATVWVDVDAAGLLAAREGSKANDPSGQGVSLVSLVARFCVLGLRRWPVLNGRVEGDEVVVGDRISLGFAAQTEQGLVVPVVHGADSLGLFELDGEIRRLAAAARDGSLTPAEATGGTFTVNNYGVFGVDGSAAIINYPQVAMIGMGRVIERPWVVEGELCVRPVTELTLAFDHRACDGGVAGGFLRYVADCVEQPLRAL
jgi:2-oxoisovalerate dehydrogenase E2 component (dihydrolipoyl transacylase)